jgi:anaphase-promoting complex subunit 2
VISPLFWPASNEEDFVLHPQVQATFDSYKREFEIFKARRKLTYRRALGTVEVEVQQGGGAARPLSVTPLQATFLLHLQDNPRWTLEDLAAVTKLTPEVVRKRMVFWLNAGVVTEAVHGGSVVFQVASEAAKPSEELLPAAEDEEASKGADPAAQAFWEILKAYVKGMLAERGACSAADIHMVLQFCSTEGERARVRAD